MLGRLGLRALDRLVRTRGYSIGPLDGLSDMPDETRSVIARVRPYTMTSRERICGLCTAVEYAVRHRIAGDFVECGVWKGGSSMAAALTFLRLGRSDVLLHLFDTFEGMSEPTPADRMALTGETADRLLASANKRSGIWAYAPLDEVKSNLLSTGYPAHRVRFVQGKVEQTLPAAAPDQICILRLDTDWYESTKHELVHLFPRLSVGGVLILDDYGHWEGARKAVDEYFEEQGVKMLLSRLDYTGRIGVKLA
jgi:O-methyltransferase